MGKKNKAKKAHVLILPFPGQGHINPMLQFATPLVSKGVKATLLYWFPDNIRWLRRRRFAQAGTPDVYLSTFQSVGSQSLANLIKKLGDAALPIIYDGFMPWALDVAKQFGLRAAVFFTQSCHYHVSRGLFKLPLEGPNVSLTVADWMSKFWKLGTIGPTIPSMYLDKRRKDDENYELGVEQMEEIAWGFKGSNCYVLWVVRGSEEAKLPDNF
ncbi:hypothetical protein CRYUN_Cryun29cG0080900 [Craigia yunnanensis]